MLVSELKKVIDIDSRITSLHQELATLYTERRQYIQHTSTDQSVLKTSPSRQTASNDAAWMQHTYNQLLETWAVYGIKAPSLRVLKKGLLKARVIINDLSANQPDLSGKLGVLLVPPVQLLGQPSENKHRHEQPFINLDDYLSDDLSKRYMQKNWRLLVAYQDETPLNLGKASELLADKKYMIGDYDTRGLGLYEYFALSLQSPGPLDQHTWTLLLKGCHAKSKTVASVTFMNGQYRFEVDDTDGVFGDERFRPAVEIVTS